MCNNDIQESIDRLAGSVQSAAGASPAAARIDDLRRLLCRVIALSGAHWAELTTVAAWQQQPDEIDPPNLEQPMADAIELGRASLTLLPEDEDGRSAMPPGGGGLSARRPDWTRAYIPSRACGRPRSAEPWTAGCP